MASNQQSKAFHFVFFGVRLFSGDALTNNRTPKTWAVMGRVIRSSLSRTDVASIREQQLIDVGVRR